MDTNPNRTSSNTAVATRPSLSVKAVMKRLKDQGINPAYMPIAIIVALVTLAVQAMYNAFAQILDMTAYDAENETENPHVAGHWAHSFWTVIDAGYSYMNKLSTGAMNVTQKHSEFARFVALVTLVIVDLPTALTELKTRDENKIDTTGLRTIADEILDTPTSKVWAPINRRLGMAIHDVAALVDSSEYTEVALATKVRTVLDIANDAGNGTYFATLYPTEMATVTARRIGTQVTVETAIRIDNGNDEDA